MRKQKNSKGQWGWTFVGTLYAFFGAHMIMTGEPGIRGGVEIPAWVGWILLPFGLLVIYLSLRTIWQNRNIPDLPVNIDEEAARAEAEMDAMYLREYGKLPDKPKKDT